MYRQQKIQKQFQDSEFRISKSIPLMDDNSRAVPFNDILIGNVLINIYNRTNNLLDNVVNDYDSRDVVINWNDKTPAIIAIEHSVDEIKEKILTNSAIVNLIYRKAGNWSEEDRDLWSGTLSQYISESLIKHELFSKYRPGKFFDTNRKRRINDLDHKAEFECEFMSIITGIIMQKVENMILKDKGINYYYVSGIDLSGNGHAWVMDDEGRVFDITFQDTPLKKGRSIHTNFKEFVA